jgi:hypothetical protein
MSCKGGTHCDTKKESIASEGQRSKVGDQREHLRGGVDFVKVIHLDEVGMQPRREVVNGHGALAAGGDVDVLDAQLQALQHPHERVMALANQEGCVVVAYRLHERVI